MEKFTLVILFVLSAFSCLLAQPVLPLDFESTTISYTFTNFGGGAVTKIANPQSNGINTSATVAKMIKSPGDDFGGSFITMASPVNFATNKIIRVKVFSPVAGRKLLLKFEGAGATFEKESIGITTANVWQELTFDFTGVAGINNSNNKIVFIFDLGAQGDGSANSTYLFDDVVQTSTYVGGVTGDYNLVWSDEFTGTGPPAADHWHRQTQLPLGGSWFGGEQQHYTNRNDNSFIANGYLNIVAKKESFTDQGQTKQYTSARLNSKYAFMYGRVDVRAKVGGGAGTLPAIWMLGKNIDEPGGYFAGEFGTTVWPATGEMDIMEHWGNNPNVIHQSIHTPSSFGATVNTNTTTISQVSTTYHVYSLIWDANQIQFLIDDVAYYTYNPIVKDANTWPFDKPLYLLLNIALGGGGDPIDPSFTQSTLEVDYVRVYQKGGTPAPLPTEPTAAATTPTRPPGNVISMFSNAYTNVPVNTWRADWSVAKLTETQVVGNDVKKYNRLDVVGIETTGANVINASSMLYFHLDAWTPNMTTFRIKLVDFGANGVYAGGDDKEAELSFTPTLSGWNSYEIPLTNFASLNTKSHIAQLVLSGIPAGTSTVFIDNVYFHNVAGVIPCIKPVKPTITISDNNTEAVLLTSNAAVGNQWFRNGTAIAGAVNTTLSVTTPGVYTVQVTVDNCVSDFSNETALFVTGDLNTLSNQVNVYPNPAENYLEVGGLHTEVKSAQLFDLTGRSVSLVFEKRGKIHYANVQHIAQGVYLLRIQEGNKNHQIIILKK